MTAVPEHVYGEIDQLASTGQVDLAYQALRRAIDQYFDKEATYRYRCLWLFHRGATIADQAGRPQVALAHLYRFITDAETLLNQDPEVQGVELKYSQVRLPRRDEVAEARSALPEVERRTFELLKENLPGKSDAEIWKEVEVVKTSLTSPQKAGGCFIATAAYGSAWEPQVESLRTFRDRTLASTVLGRAVIRFYASVSPPIAARIQADSFSGAAVRVMLSPFVCAVRIYQRRERQLTSSDIARSQS